MHFQIGLNINGCSYGIFNYDYSSLLPCSDTVILQLSTFKVLVNEMFAIFVPGMVSTHLWCIQQQFLCAVKVVTTMFEG